MKKRVLCLALALAMFLAAAPSAYADEADVAKSEGGVEITPDYAEEVREMRGGGILDAEELDRMVDEFLTERKLKKDNVAIGYCYLETGDEYFYNPDIWFYPGSVYKVPLMMLVAEKVRAGEIKQEDDFLGMPWYRVEEYILTYSNNDWAHHVRRWLHDGAGDQVWRKAAMAYADLDESYYSPDYVDYCYYSARYITRVLETLYAGGEERFPNVIPCLLKANPTNYFKLTEQMRQYDIAQKYGSWVDNSNRNWNAAVGIIYTEHPIIVSVLTQDIGDAEKNLSDIALMLTNYTTGTVDASLSGYREAQARAEQQRQEEARAEAERRQAETEEAKRAELEREQQQTTQQRQQKGEHSIALIVGIVGAALALALIVGAVLGARRKKEKRYEGYRHRLERELSSESQGRTASRQTAAQRKSTTRQSAAASRQRSGKAVTGRHVRRADEDEDFRFDESSFRFDTDERPSRRTQIERPRRPREDSEEE